jgi:hypothetical protein
VGGGRSSALCALLGLRDCNGETVPIGGLWTMQIPMLQVQAHQQQIMACKYGGNCCNRRQAVV